jgi:hypothetical protein
MTQNVERIQRNFVGHNSGRGVGRDDGSRLYLESRDGGQAIGPVAVEACVFIVLTKSRPKSVATAAGGFQFCLGLRHSRRRRRVETRQSDTRQSVAKVHGLSDT